MVLEIPNLSRWLGTHPCHKCYVLLTVVGFDSLFQRQRSLKCTESRQSDRGVFVLVKDRLVFYFSIITSIITDIWTRRIASFQPFVLASRLRESRRDKKATRTFLLAVPRWLRVDYVFSRATTVALRFCTVPGEVSNYHDV